MPRATARRRLTRPGDNQSAKRPLVLRGHVVELDAAVGPMDTRTNDLSNSPTSPGSTTEDAESPGIKALYDAARKRLNQTARDRLKEWLARADALYFIPIDGDPPTTFLQPIIARGL